MSLKYVAPTELWMLGIVFYRYAAPPGLKNQVVLLGDSGERLLDLAVSNAGNETCKFHRIWNLSFARGRRSGGG